MKWFFGGIAVCVFLMPIACERTLDWLVEDPPKPQAGRWDFSKSRDVSIVGWPADSKSDTWGAGRFTELRVILPDGQVQVFRDVAPWVRRKGNRVVGFYMNLYQESLDDAVEVARGWAQRWGATNRVISVDEFKASVLKDPNYPRVLSGQWNASSDQVSIAILPGSPRINLPWRVNISMAIGG